MTSNSPSRLRYVPQLDGLRALAVFMVFMHHALNVPLLWSGVDLFFLLSGYLITNILLRDSLRMSFGSMLGQFYLRRAERILPAYILFLLCAYPFGKAEWHLHWPDYVFFLQNVPLALHPGTISVYVPLWSLAIEQHFYLFWPVLIFFLPRKWLAPLMVTLICLVPVLRVLCTPLFRTSETIYAGTPFRLDALAAGALVALLLPQGLPAARGRLAIRTGQVAMILGICTYALLAFHHPWFSRTANTRAFNGAAYSLNILILGGLFVWVLLADDTWLTRFLSLPVLRWLGRISYGFYLFHFLILSILERTLHLPRPLQVLLGFILTALVATLSWNLLEKRVLALSASHRRPAPAAAG